MKVLTLLLSNNHKEVEWKYTDLCINLPKFKEKPIYGIQLEENILECIYKTFEEIETVQTFQIYFDKSYLSKWEFPENSFTLWRITPVDGEILLEQAITHKTVVDGNYNYD